VLSLALILSFTWFLTAFVLRIAIQVRATGDTGVRANAGTTFSRGWWARLAFTASIAVVVASPVLASLDVVDPVAALDVAAVGWTGLVLAVTGIGATFWAQLAMGSSWRIGVDPSERTDLVTTGMFGVVRNPIFSTMAVTALGLTLMVPTPVGMAGVAFLVTALEVQVRAVEEPYLHAVHGASYRAYATTVGRFVPKLPTGQGGRGPSGPAPQAP
jgi:protein-S-isoprenylcysteine O-methyltransferase Ste14